MKTMIKTMTGALVLVFAQVALAVCPADCTCPKCTAKAAKTTKTQCGPDCKKPCCAGDKKSCKLDAVAKGFKRVTYKVSGITCKKCPAIIKKNVAKVDGASVKCVCVKSGTVVVDYDPKKVKKAAITAALNQGKFKVVTKKACSPNCNKPCCAGKQAK